MMLKITVQVDVIRRDAIQNVYQGLGREAAFYDGMITCSTLPVYKTLPQADITCLDYSPDMMATAQRRAKTAGLMNVRFQQGDVGALPFKDASFDLVLSLNGFHTFPDKEAAYREIYRVLRPGGIFCGCFYVKDENCRTDWFVDKLYTPKGFFTPPYETSESLRQRLKRQYQRATVETVESMACFICRKDGDKK